jgi:hypothetical protein
MAVAWRLRSSRPPSRAKWMGINIQVTSLMININRCMCSVEGLGTGGPVAMASSRAEGPITVAQQGLMARRTTMTLIGEAGPEAVMPLKGGAIPARLDARGLRAVLPDVFGLFSNNAGSYALLVKAARKSL